MIRKSGIIALCALLLIGPVLCTGQVTAVPPVKDPGGGGSGGPDPDDYPYFWGNVYGVSDTDQYRLANVELKAVYYFFNAYGTRFPAEDITHTDSYGEYEFTLYGEIVGDVDFNYGVTLQVKKAGYWTQWSVFHSYRGYTWMCSEDQIAYVPKLLSFSNTDDTVFRFVSSVTAEVTVAAYMAGSGSSWTYEMTFSEGYENPLGGQLQVFQMAMSTGVCHYEPTTQKYVIDQAWLYGNEGEYIGGEIYSIPETMDPPGDTSKQKTIEPGLVGDGYCDFYSEGSVRLGYDISVGVGGKLLSVSVELEVYIEITVSSSLDYYWKITNHDLENIHVYEWYLETSPNLGFVMHIWQIS